MLVVLLVFVFLVCGISVLFDFSKLGCLGIKLVGLYIVIIVIVIILVMSMVLLVLLGEGLSFSIDIIY